MDTKSLIESLTDTAYFSQSPSKYHVYVISHNAGDILCRKEPSRELTQWISDYRSCNVEFAVNYLTNDEVVQMVRDYATRRCLKIQETVKQVRVRLFGGLTLGDNDDMYPSHLRLPRYHPFYLCQSKEMWCEVLRRDEATRYDVSSDYCFKVASPSVTDPTDTLEMKSIASSMSRMDTVRIAYKRSMRVRYLGDRSITFEAFLIKVNSGASYVDEYLPSEIPERYRVSVSVPLKKDSIVTEVEECRLRLLERSKKEADVATQLIKERRRKR